MAINLLVLDVETTLNAPKDMGQAHPMHPDNRIVLLGTLCTTPWGDKEIEITDLMPITGLVDTLELCKPDFICGSNMSFDLLYLYREASAYSSLGKKVLQEQRLWDIQLAEYLLTGQQSKWASLDDMCRKYGLPIKDDAVTKFFEAGVGSDKIDRALLDPYLRNDLEVTHAIAQLQIAQAVDAKMLPLIISQMEALHATTEMMFNGLSFDEPYFRKYTYEVATTYADLKITLEKEVKDFIGSGYYPLEDIDSALQWSKFLFGGNSKQVSREAVGMFKNGNTKYKNIEREVTHPPSCEIVPAEGWKSEKTGKVSVDEKVLTIIATHTKLHSIKAVVDKLLKYRETSKQLSTYIQGLHKHIIHHPDGCAFIHGRLNHVATATGRLSSTAPNLQNISNNPIKVVFVSRFGADGVLVEFDFAQLEVAVLAHISGCKQLIADISGGKDIHSELYFDMNGVRPSDSERKWFKKLTFGLLYGAGANTLAENAGCDYSVAKKFIATFYTRYPAVKTWHDTMATQAELLGTHPKIAGMFGDAREWMWQSETGRKYLFKEYKNTYRTDREFTFSPTELKNYPVQGLATGDIVPMMLGILFRKFQGDDNVKLVNTVHDSIMFDVHKDVLTETLKEVNTTLSLTHEYYLKTFKIPLSLKLTASASVGANWFTTEKVK